MKIFHVDAFTNRLFSGNPAAVVPLDSWVSEERMRELHVASTWEGGE